jgi:hypothetical protein
MHAGLLASQVQGATLAAVPDAVPAVAQEVGRTLGIPALETSQLLADPAIDAVAICADTSRGVRPLWARWHQPGPFQPSARSTAFRAWSGRYNIVMSLPTGPECERLGGDLLEQGWPCV